MVEKITYRIVGVLVGGDNAYKIQRTEHHKVLRYIKWEETSFLKFPLTRLGSYSSRNVSVTEKSHFELKTAKSLLETINSIINFCGSYGNPYYAGIDFIDYYNSEVIYYIRENYKDWSIVARNEKEFKEKLSKSGKIYDSIVWRSENMN